MLKKEEKDKSEKSDDETWKDQEKVKVSSDIIPVASFLSIPVTILSISDHQ